MTGCDYEVQPMVFCRLELGHLGVHRFSDPIERMILRGQVPWPATWPMETESLLEALGVARK